MSACQTDLQAIKEEQKEDIKKEIRWIDAWIRWEKNDDYDEDDDDSNSEDEMTTPNPTEIFSFSFSNPACGHVSTATNACCDSTHHNTSTTYCDEKYIDIELYGYKSESEQIWNSTGLTLWRSAEHLCDYLVKHPSLLQHNKRVLELGSGLGLCGILAHQLMIQHQDSQMPLNNNGRQEEKEQDSTSSCIFLTDGDTDVLSQLRANIKHNTDEQVPNGSSDASTNSTDDSEDHATIRSRTTSLYCRQLLWGDKHAHKFLKQQCCDREFDTIETISTSVKQTSSSLSSSYLFDVILGADLVYAPGVIQPLFETIQVLLNPTSGVFLFAYCSRRQGSTSLDLVLETATKFDFTYECVNKDDDDDGISIYIFRLSSA